MLSPSITIQRRTDEYELVGLNVFIFQALRAIKLAIIRCTTATSNIRKANFCGLKLMIFLKFHQEIFFLAVLAQVRDLTQ